MEDRVVPAQLMWTNGTSDGLASTAANWTDILSGPSVVPGAGDYVLFGSGGSNTNCLVDINNWAVDRVMMDSGYTATLTIATGNTLTATNHIEQWGTLELERGSTVHAGTYIDLSGLVDVITTGSGVVTLDADGTLYQNAYAAIVTWTDLDIVCSAFDDGGAITIYGSSTVNITGAYVQLPDAYTQVLSYCTLNYVGGGDINPNIEGTVDLVGGTITTDEQMRLQGTLNVIAGASDFEGDLRIVNSGTLNIGDNTWSATLNHNSGSITVGAMHPSLTPTGGTINLYPQSGLDCSAGSGGDFVVMQAGVINLYGSNYGTTIDASRFGAIEVRAVNPSYPTLPAGTIHCVDNGNLIIGDLNMNGVLILEGNLNVLTITGDYTQGPDATLSLRMQNTAPYNDALDVGGVATLDGTLSLTGLEALSDSQTWTILTYGSGTGDFSSFLFPDSDPDWTGFAGASAYDVIN